MIINTKYNVGDSVWFILESKAKQGSIDEIKVESKKDKIRIQYFIKIDKTEEESHSFSLVDENEVFSTREELIGNL